MSPVSSFRPGVVSAGICCMLAAVAIAQQPQQTQKPNQRNTGAQSERSTSASGAGQSGRASSTQSDQSGAQQGGLNQAGQTRTANFRGPQGAGAGGAESQAVDHFFTACLLAGNQAEVEMSQLAQQQSENQQVKQFAEKMVQDHQKMIQQLEQVAGAQRGAPQPGNAATSATGEAGLPGSSGAGQTAARAGEAGGSTANSTADATNSLAGAGQSSAGSAVVGQLVAMDRQIVQRKSQMAKEELQQKSGADFDKCYIGNAINAHVHALAALEVISQSQGQLAQVAQQAQPVVKQHLDHAKGLMKELDGQSSGGNSSSPSERSTSKSER